MNYIGIDCGSTSCKLIIIDENKKTLYKDNIPVHGDTLSTVKTMLSNIPTGFGNEFVIGVTGSSRLLLSKYLKTNIAKSEIIAHTIGALCIKPEIHTIIEIGGQDSKLICIENGLIKEFNINSVCAAGTGAFIESQANRLGLSLTEFDDLASKSKTILPLMGKCSVFIESAIINQQKIGAKKEDIAFSLCAVMAKNYVNELIKGKQLKEPVYMQGGVARIESIVNALSKEIGMNISVFDDCEYIGAFGMAVCAIQTRNAFPINIKNIGINKTMTIEHSVCSDCSNGCTLFKYYFDGVFEFYMGGRCGKYN